MRVVLLVGKLSIINGFEWNSKPGRETPTERLGYADEQRDISLDRHPPPSLLLPWPARCLSCPLYSHLFCLDDYRDKNSEFASQLKIGEGLKINLLSSAFHRLCFFRAKTHTWF